MGRPEQVSRSQVLAVARQVFAERGYAGTTLAQIASRLGLSPAALLRHAPTKEALFLSAMSSDTAPENLPIEYLAELDASKNDPIRVLRGVAEVFVPFIEAKMGENIARWMHARTAEEARTIRLAFDPRQRPTPPQRVVHLLEDYLRRAKKAGRIWVRNPRSAAIIFLGGLHIYVFLHRVLRIEDPQLPLKDYVDDLLELWKRGAKPTRKRRT